MEKAAVTGNKAGIRWESALLACAAAAPLLCAAAPASEGSSLPPEGVIVADARNVPLRLDVQASTLPRMEAQDNGFQASRVDMSLLPRQDSALGPTVGVSGFATRPGMKPVGGDTLGLQQMRPSLDVGLRFSQRLRGQHQVDITAWRRMTQEDDAMSLIQAREERPLYGARIEMGTNSSSRKSGFAMERGFVGMQLASGARISIRRKHGGAMLYYRTTF